MSNRFFKNKAHSQLGMILGILFMVLFLTSQTAQAQTNPSPSNPTDPTPTFACLGGCLTGTPAVTSTPTGTSTQTPSPIQVPQLTFRNKGQRVSLLRHITNFFRKAGLPLLSGGQNSLPAQLGQPTQAGQPANDGNGGAPGRGANPAGIVPGTGNGKFNRVGNDNGVPPGSQSGQPNQPSQTNLGTSQGLLTILLQLFGNPAGGAAPTR